MKVSKEQREQLAEMLINQKPYLAERMLKEMEQVKKNVKSKK